MEGEAHMLRLVSPLSRIISSPLSYCVGCPGVRTRPGAVVGASALKQTLLQRGKPGSWVTVTQEQGGLAGFL